MKALAALVLTAVVVLSGCSSPTQGVAQPAPETGRDAGAVIAKPKQAGEPLNCEQVAPTSLMNETAGTAVSPYATATANSNICEVEVKRAQDGRAVGAIRVGVVTLHQGEQTGEFEGNTLIELPKPPRSCWVYVAIGRKDGKVQWLYVTVQLPEITVDGACEKSKALTKTVFDTLPDGK